jgi:hypothetical protein
VSDTPRTDAEAFLPHDSKYRVCDADFARQLERELNAANAIIKQQQLLNEENLRLQDRIKRLEEAGYAMYENSDPTKWDLREASNRKLKEQEAWRKAKEAKP